jgi:hypothetical protein
MLSSMLIKLLFRFASKRTFWTWVRSFSAMVHLVLLQLPLGSKHFLANAALFWIFGIVDLQMKPQSP